MGAVHLGIAIVLGLIAFGIAKAIGLDDPQPLIVGLVVLCAYFGIVLIVVDVDDLFD